MKAKRSFIEGLRFSHPQAPLFSSLPFWIYFSIMILNPFFWIGYLMAFLHYRKLNKDLEVKK